MLALLLNLLDSAKVWGAIVANHIISNLSRPRKTHQNDAAMAASTEFDYTPAPTPGPRLQLYFGRYFERKPELSLAIRYLELPKNEEVFQFILKQLPAEVHAWAHAMFLESGAKEFKKTARGHTLSEAETIASMQLAARRWEWQQQEAAREKKLELRKKFNADKELENDAYNPRM